MSRTFSQFYNASWEGGEKASVDRCCCLSTIPPPLCLAQQSNKMCSLAPPDMFFVSLFVQRLLYLTFSLFFCFWAVVRADFAAFYFLPFCCISLVFCAFIGKKIIEKAMKY